MFLHFIISLILYSVSAEYLSVWANTTALSQCQMIYALKSNQEASTILVKKFGFSVGAVNALLSNPKFNQTILDLLLAYSELTQKERVNGNVYEELIRAMKKPEYHESNSEDEQAAMMISLPAADLWPVNLNAIVQKTRLINDILKTLNTSISRPSFELLVAVLSQFNFHEKYAPSLSDEGLTSRKIDLLENLTSENREKYFFEQASAYPVTLRKVLVDFKKSVDRNLNAEKIIAEKYSHTSKNINAVNQKYLSLWQDMSEKVNLATSSTNDADLVKYGKKLMGRYLRITGQLEMEGFFTFASPLQRFFASTQPPLKSWKDWSNFYISEFKERELKQIAEEGGKVPNYYFEVEQDYLRLISKPTDLNKLTSRAVKDSIESLLRKKFAQMKSIAQFELAFDDLVTQERHLENETPIADIALIPEQVFYLKPKSVPTNLDHNTLATNIAEMIRIVSSLGANPKIGREVAHHFVIRAEKYRRIFLKTLIKLIEGRGSLVPVGTKKLTTESGEIFEFNRLGSYRLFFAFFDEQVVLLHIDHVKDGQTLSTQQRAIDLADERFSEYKKKRLSLLDSSTPN